MANRSVSLYDLQKIDGKWKYIPLDKELIAKKKRKISENTRRGNYYISWYEGERKRFRKAGDLLVAAIAMKETQEFNLARISRGEQPVALADDAGRLTIATAVQTYLEGLVKRPTTLALHEQNLHQFRDWCSHTYVDQITRQDLLKFQRHLLTSGHEKKAKSGVSPSTAAWKVIRINQWIKATLGLKPGEGLVKTTEFKKIIHDDRRPEIYEQHELDKFFAACRPDERLLFQMFLKSGLRMKEMMYLEWSDVNFTRRELHVGSKAEYDFVPKNGKARDVLIPTDLADKLQTRKETSRHSLVFPTRTGKPDTKMWDKAKAVARRAGLAEESVWIHKFRGTFATTLLRSGIDIATVREQMGHKDYASVEAYLAILKNEQLAMSGRLDAAWA